MSKKNTKPQWLIDAEKAIKKSKDSKYANWTDAQLSQYVNRIDSDYQREQAKKFWDNPENEAKQKEVLAKWRQGNIDSNGSQRGGLKNVETGHIKALGQKHWKTGMDARNEEVTCEVCGTKCTKGNYAKWHGKKCKHNDIMKVFNALPEEFTRKQVIKVVEGLGAPKNFTRKIVNDNYLDMIKVVHKGTNGSSIDVPRYRKIVK